MGKGRATTASGTAGKILGVIPGRSPQGGEAAADIDSRRTNYTSLSHLGGGGLGRAQEYQAANTTTFL